MQKRGFIMSKRAEDIVVNIVGAVAIWISGCAFFALAGLISQLIN